MKAKQSETKNGCFTFYNTSFSVYVCSTYPFSIITFFLRLFSAYIFFVSFFSTSMTFPNAPLPMTFKILKSSMVTLIVWS